MRTWTFKDQHCFHHSEQSHQCNNEFSFSKFLKIEKVINDEKSPNTKSLSLNISERTLSFFFSGIDFSNIFKLIFYLCQRFYLYFSCPILFPLSPKVFKLTFGFCYTYMKQKAESGHREVLPKKARKIKYQRHFTCRMPHTKTFRSCSIFLWNNSVHTRRLTFGSILS